MSGERIYVAGSSAERERAHSCMQRAEELGYVVSLDWTQATSWDDPSPSEEVLVEAARADEDAVRSAELLWYLTPSVGKSEGSAFELGVARALGKVILVSGALDRVRIFPRLAEYRFEQADAIVADEEALSCLRTRAWLNAHPVVMQKLLATLRQVESMHLHERHHESIFRAARKLEHDGLVKVEWPPGLRRNIERGKWITVRAK